VKITISWFDSKQEHIDNTTYDKENLRDGSFDVTRDEKSRNTN
jgi:hypothetical protein